MNQALIGKWLWRLGEDLDCLWSQVIVAKYGVMQNCWDLQGPATDWLSGLWRGIVALKEFFYASIRFWVGFGENIPFGLVSDLWQLSS